MTITLEEFKKITLQVGTITSAQAHPDADRLLVLRVDLGSETRQLVAGIRSSHAPEDLIGRQVVVVTNLAPATIRGVESQGMMLCAHDDTTLAILSPEQPVTNGASIR